MADVENQVPEADSNILPTTRIEFDVSDAGSPFSLWLMYPDGQIEVAWTGTVFAPVFMADSSFTGSAPDYHYVLYRTGGWRKAPTIITGDPLDAGAATAYGSAPPAIAAAGSAGSSGKWADGQHTHAHDGTTAATANKLALRASGTAACSFGPLTAPSIKGATTDFSALNSNNYGLSCTVDGVSVVASGATIDLEQATGNVVVTAPGSLTIVCDNDTSLATGGAVAISAAAGTCTMTGETGASVTATTGALTLAATAGAASMTAGTTTAVTATTTATMTGPTSASMTSTNSTRLQVSAVSMVEAALVASGRRAVGFCVAGNLDTTKLPANTGDAVAFWGNCATVPTSVPNNTGCGIYADAGQLMTYRSTNAWEALNSVVGTGYTKALKDRTVGDAVTQASTSVLTAGTIKATYFTGLTGVGVAIVKVKGYKAGDVVVNVRLLKFAVVSGTLSVLTSQTLGIDDSASVTSFDVSTDLRVRVTPADSTSTKWSCSIEWEFEAVT